jgi:tetratricopeptide (TPR) repeat protein
LLLSYARPAERIAGIFFLLVFILIYPAFRYATRLSAATSEKFVATYMTVFSEGPTPKAIKDLEEFESENPKDADASILLAYVYKMDGRLQRSIEMLQKHILAHPRDDRAYNNLANIFFLQEETESALTLCEKASMLNPQNAVYQYNLSNLHRAKFEFNEAEKLLEEARQINPELIRRIESGSRDRLVDEIPTDSVVWSHIQKKNGDPVQSLMNPFSLAAGACLIFGLINIAPLRKKTHAQACSKCGKAFCKRCHPGPREYGLCTQCLHIFVKRDGVSPVSRKEKLDEIEVYSRRQNILVRLLSLILPGSSSFYHNRTLFGILILLPWVFLLVSLLFNARLSHLTLTEPSDGTAVLTPLYIVFLALLYVLANLHQIRRSNV